MMRRSFKRFSWVGPYDNILKSLMVDEGRWDFDNHCFKNGYCWASILVLFLEKVHAMHRSDHALARLTSRHLERRWFSHVHPASPRNAGDELRRIRQFLSAYLNANSTVPLLSLPKVGRLRQACHLLGSNEWILRESREVWAELINFETESEFEFDMDPVGPLPNDPLWLRLGVGPEALDVVPYYLVQRSPPDEAIDAPVLPPNMVEGIAGLFPVSVAPETISPVNDFLSTQPFLCPEDGVPGLARRDDVAVPAIDAAKAMPSLRYSRVSPWLFSPSRPMSPVLTPCSTDISRPQASNSLCVGMELAADDVLFSHNRMDYL